VENIGLLGSRVENIRLLGSRVENIGLLGSRVENIGLLGSRVKKISLHFKWCDVIFRILELFPFPAISLIYLYIVIYIFKTIS